MGITKSMLGMKKINYVKLDKPIEMEATRNYLPKDVEMQAAYTIYEETKWVCKYKTDAGDSICCSDRTISMGSWKYCLLVDEHNNGFAFFELGTSEYLPWSEGKQPLFKKIEEGL